MGGAQPLAVTMNEGVSITVEVDESRIERRIKSGYLDKKVYDKVSSKTNWDLYELSS